MTFIHCLKGETDYKKTFLFRSNFSISLSLSLILTWHLIFKMVFSAGKCNIPPESVIHTIPFLRFYDSEWPMDAVPDRSASVVLNILYNKQINYKYDSRLQSYTKLIQATLQYIYRFLNWCNWILMIDKDCFSCS